MSPLDASKSGCWVVCNWVTLGHVARPTPIAVAPARGVWVCQAWVVCLPWFVGCQRDEVNPCPNTQTESEQQVASRKGQGAVFGKRTINSQCENIRLLRYS